MSCKFKIVENLFRETQPELADFLNEKGLQVWSLIKNSKLFKAKDGKYSLSPVTTAKRQKQIEFIDSLEDFVYLDKEDVVVDLLKVLPQNISLSQGLNWAQKLMPDLKIELIEDLVDNIGRGAYNSVSDLITLSKKYADKKTVKHEVFHKAFNNSSSEKKESLLNEGSRLFDIKRGESKVITKYSKEQQNEISYVLKAVDILQSEKARQVFEKGEKAKWSLDKILTELQVPKEQKQLILDLGISGREQIALELASNYSFTVEVNTAKEQLNREDRIDEVYQSKYPNKKIGDIITMSNNVNYLIVGEGLLEDNDDWDSNDKIIPSFKLELKNVKKQNTSHYSYLTVPGGTNYIENDIATPLITPSIKGHAQFATDNGIGWFRSDEQLLGKGTVVQRIENNYVPELIGRINTKTRRILEIQSDLFQKGRDSKELAKGERVIDKLTIKEEYEYDELKHKFNHPGDGNDGIWSENDENRFQELRTKMLIDKSKFNKENQFLQLLNKDNNWVNFFIKAIVQNSVKKGYEKILFPTGNTASKVEGHSTLEEFKKQKEERIRELENSKFHYRITDQESNSKQKWTVSDSEESFVFDSLEEANDFVNKFGHPEDYTTPKLQLSVSEINKQQLLRIDDEIAQLKQELERVETEGLGALKPIYNFYENTVTNILKKQGLNPILITDEYGNTWSEIDLSNRKVKEQTDLIKFQAPNLEYKGDLAIEEKLAEMFENTADEDLPKTLIGQWVLAVRNFFRNIFKERSEITRFFRDINQGRINNLKTVNSNNPTSPSEVVYQLPQGKEVEEIKAAIENNLPPEITNSITILQDVPLDILGRNDLFLSMKDILEEKGITNPFLINWFGITLSSNLSRGQAIKNINSEFEIEKLANASYNKLLELEDPILKNKDIKESFDKWVNVLENYPVVFKDLMLKHAIKHLRNPERRSKFVLQLSTVALQQTYGIAVNKPHELNRIGKLYDQEVLKTVSDAVGHEPSASGKGYWVHIPKTMSGKLNDWRITKGPGGKDMEWAVEYLFDEEGGLEFFDTEQEARDFVNKRIPIDTSAQFKVNVELLKKLSPSTWCTASGMASHYVENYDNYLLIVDGVTVAGIEAGNIGDNGKVQVKEVTSRGNNGTSSIDHYDDIFSFFEKHNLDTDNNSLQKAKSAKDTGKKDKDFIVEVDHEGYDNYQPDLYEGDDRDDLTLEYRREREENERLFEEDLERRITAVENLNTVEEVLQNPDYLELFQSLKPELRNNEKIARKAIEYNAYNITFIDSNLPFYNELVTTAVTDSPDVFQYLPDNIKEQRNDLKKKYDDYIIKKNKETEERLLRRQTEEEAITLARSIRYNQAEIERVRTINPTLTLSQILNEIDFNNHDDLPFSKTNTSQIQGYYDAKNDKVVVIASNTTVKEAPRIAIHEVAHRGMLRMAKELGGDRELFQVLKNSEKQLMQKLPELLKRTGHKSLDNLMLDYGFDKNSEEGKFKLLQELAARWSETLVDKPKPTWWKELLQKIGTWINKFTSKILNENEVNELVGGFVKYGTQDIQTPTVYGANNEPSTLYPKIVDYIKENGFNPNEPYYKDYLDAGYIKDYTPEELAIVHYNLAYPNENIEPAQLFETLTNPEKQVLENYEIDPITISTAEAKLIVYNPNEAIRQTMTYFKTMRGNNTENFYVQVRDKQDKLYKDYGCM